MESEPLIHWPQPILEYLGFLAAFFSVGAVGFRAMVLGRAGISMSAAPEERAIFDRAASRAALIGLIGVVIGLALIANRLPPLAARRHTTVAQLLTHDAPTMVQVGLAALALLGLGLALARRSPGWPLATLGVVLGMLRGAFFGQWTRLVNPIHELAGGLWIGTLFVMVAAGFSAVLAGRVAPDRRGAIAARMVNVFSPFALASAALLATFGVITAWTHLKRLDALWTTPYGWALVTKLCLVLAVVVLGAWNWRRQRPRLGSEDAALSLRRSARAEIFVAALVLVVTAVLVSLPSPK